MPLLVASKWQKMQQGGAYPSLPRRENKKHTIGHNGPSLPSSSSSPSHVFYCVIVWWHAGVAGGGGGEGGEGDGGGGW